MTAKMSKKKVTAKMSAKEKKGLQKPESVQMWKENLLSVEC